MAVTRIVANLSTRDPMALAKFYQQVFELDLPLDMGWITFLSKGTAQKIELHTASEGGGGTELPVISIGVTDLAATERAVRAAGGGSGLWPRFGKLGISSVLLSCSSGQPRERRR